jgi:hypothetical protein
MPPPGHLAAVGLNEAGGARGGHRPSPARVVGNPTCATCRGDGPRRRRPMEVDAGPRHSPSAASPRVEGPVLAHGASPEGGDASLPRRPWPSRGPYAPSSAGDRDRARGTPPSSRGAGRRQRGIANLYPSNPRRRPAVRRGPHGTAAGPVAGRGAGCALTTARPDRARESVEPRYNARRRASGEPQACRLD